MSNTMRPRTKIYQVSREKAIELASNHNCVPKEVAKGYTDSELKEVLRHLSSTMCKLKPNF